MLAAHKQGCTEGLPPPARKLREWAWQAGTLDKQYQGEADVPVRADMTDWWANKRGVFRSQATLFSEPKSFFLDTSASFRYLGSLAP